MRATLVRIPMVGDGEKVNATRIIYPMLNGIFRTQLKPTDVDARVKATLSYFGSHKLPLIPWISQSTRLVLKSKIYLDNSAVLKT
jgi:hypothetical protein